MIRAAARKQSLRGVMLVTAIAFGSLLIASMGLLLSLSASIRQALDRSTEQLMVEQRIADRIVSASYGQQLAAYRVLESPRASSLQEFRAHGEEAYAGIRQYLLRPLPLSARLKVETIKEAHQDFEVAAQHAFDLALGGEPGAARARTQTVTDKAAKIEGAVGSFMADREQNRLELRAGQEAALQRLQRAMIALTIALAVAALILASVLRRLVMLPIYDLATAVRALGAGADLVRVAPQRYREFQLLADSFDGMAEKVHDARAEVQTRNQELLKAMEDMQHLQRELVQHEKLSAMGEMLAGLAHELNNPLAAILGIAECLKLDLSESNGRAGRGTVAALIDPLVAESLRARDLVRNLLHFSRASESQLESVRLSRAMELAISLRRHVFVQNGKTIDVDVAPDLYVVAHQQKLELAIINLMNNALDAMSGAPGCALHIQAHRTENIVVIVFQDEGPGFLRPERVFEPFYTTKPVGSGTGLGLSLVHRFVEQFGGTVSAENARPTGARVTIRLIAAPAPTAEPGHSDQIRTPGGSDVEPSVSIRPRILIVDDEQTICEVQRRMLRQLAVDVETVASGEEACAKLRQGPYDLIITDLRMPGPVDGRELIEWIARERPELASRTLVATGELMDLPGRVVSTIPDEQMIQKPFDRADYLFRVKRALTSTASPA